MVSNCTFAPAALPACPAVLAKHAPATASTLHGTGRLSQAILESSMLLFGRQHTLLDKPAVAPRNNPSWSNIMDSPSRPAWYRTLIGK